MPSNFEERGYAKFDDYLYCKRPPRVTAFFGINHVVLFRNAIYLANVFPTLHFDISHFLRILRYFPSLPSKAKRFSKLPPILLQKG